MLPHSTRTEEARPGCGKDRIADIRMPGRTLFLVVDGSGGVPRGDAAAEAICGAASAYQDWRIPSDWAGWLARVDREMSRSPVGHASAVVIEISGRRPHRRGERGGLRSLDVPAARRRRSSRLGSPASRSWARARPGP